MKNQKCRPSHYLADKIHETLEDKFQVAQARIRGIEIKGYRRGKGRTRLEDGSTGWKDWGIKRWCKVKFIWTPGHEDIEGNEQADEEAKRAAERGSSPLSSYPHSNPRMVKRATYIPTNSTNEGTQLHPTIRRLHAHRQPATTQPSQPTHTTPSRPRPAERASIPNQTIRFTELPPLWTRKPRNSPAFHPLLPTLPSRQTTTTTRSLSRLTLAPHPAKLQKRHPPPPQVHQRNETSVDHLRGSASVRRFLHQRQRAQKQKSSNGEPPS